MTKCGDVKLLAGVIPQEEETHEREREREKMSVLTHSNV